MSAAALVDEAVAEIDRGVVDNLGLLVRKQALVAAVGWDEALWFRHSTRRNGKRVQNVIPGNSSGRKTSRTPRTSRTLRTSRTSSSSFGVPAVLGVLGVLDRGPPHQKPPGEFAAWPASRKSVTSAAAAPPRQPGSELGNRRFSRRFRPRSYLWSGRPAREQARTTRSPSTLAKHLVLGPPAVSAKRVLKLRLGD